MKGRLATQAKDAAISLLKDLPARRETALCDRNPGPPRFLPKPR